MIFKKIISSILVLLICIQFIGGLQQIKIVKAEEFTNQSRMLNVKGNKIVFEDDESVEVVLTGVNIPGAAWTATPSVERVMETTKEAMNNWNCNLIRLCVSTGGWFGEKMGNYQPSDGGAAYRKYIDDVIKEVSKAGKWVILDLHEFGIFNQKMLNFWLEAAEKYANNPTVLFGILNEPKDVNWNVWRNGNGGSQIGHQAIIEKIRDLGARNIIVAGGISYANDLRGVVDQYALIDQGSGNDKTKAGNGIMYDLHMYAWHGGVKEWDSKAGEARKKYPILMGEFGWDAGLNEELGNKVFPPGHQQYHDKWMPEIFEWMNDVERYGNYVHWTAFSFHPTSSPCLVEKEGFKNGVYTPTTHFGVYVKEELKNRLGYNIAYKKAAESSESSPVRPVANAFDGDKNSFWQSLVEDDKYISVDLGEIFLINRYIIDHATDQIFTAKDFKLQVSMDNQSWEDVDDITGNTAIVTDRFITPTQARYVRLLITGDNAVRIHDLAIVGKDARNLVPLTPPENISSGQQFVDIKQNCDFTKGERLDDWGTINGDDELKLTYPEGAAEDGICPALHLSGGTNQDQYKFIGLHASMLGDFRQVEKWKLRMRSSTDIKIQFKQHYRVTNLERFTNMLILPSTNGQWANVYFDINDLMPTPQDTWVKNMWTQYNVNYKDFEPIINMLIQVPLGDNYIEISHIHTLVYKNGFNMSSIEFSNGGIVTNDGLRSGKTDIDIRLANLDDSYLNNVLLQAAMFEKNTNRLVSLDTKVVSISPNFKTRPHRLSVQMPDGANVSVYYVKVYSWKDANSIVPITYTITLDENGILIN